VLLVYQDFQALLVHVELLAFQDHKVLLVKLEFQEYLVLLVNLERLVSKVILDHRV
jgi:hypothetical protein